MTAKIVLAMRCASAIAATFVFFRISMSDSQSDASPHLRLTMMVIALRRHTLLPLNDCLYALQPTIPHLTKAALH
jgi:hypothetical protein